jgi:WS/DGAT/MGAT family acyltransferase
LINWLHSEKQTLALILDDWHRVDNPETTDALAYLLENCCHHLHVIVASRARTGLPLSTLRVWADDKSFDLDYHLRRIRLPKPGTTRQLLDAAQQLGAVPLDPSRPPWVATFIEGLEGGRSAYFLVVHHVLMDGHGSVQLLSDLHGRPARRPAEAPRDEIETSKAPHPVRLAADQYVGRLRSVPRLAGQAASGLFGALRAGPVGNARFAASVARVLTPPSGKASDLLKDGSRTQWRYEILDCSPSELKAAGKAAGGTVNDAYVAGIIGGLRIYHEKHGADIGDITINMPVSLRRPDDAEGGNRFVTAFINHRRQSPIRPNASSVFESWSPKSVVSPLSISLVCFSPLSIERLRRY